MLRTVKFLSTFSCVSLRDMKETGAASRPVPPNHSDIRRAQVLQPPDSSSDILRGSSLIAEQSPASSHSRIIALPPYRDFGIIHQHPRVCQGLFQIFLANFPPDSPRRSVEKNRPRLGRGRGGGKRPPFPLLPPLLCAMIPKSGPCSGPITFLNRKESNCL